MAEQYRARMAGMTPAELNNYIKFLYINQRDIFLYIMTDLRINDVLAVCKADVEFYNACNNDPVIWDYFSTRLTNPKNDKPNPLGLTYKDVGSYLYELTGRQYPRFLEMTLSRQLIIYKAMSFAHKTNGVANKRLLKIVEGKETKLVFTMSSYDLQLRYKKPRLVKPPKRLNKR